MSVISIMGDMIVSYPEMEEEEQVVFGESEGKQQYFFYVFQKYTKHFFLKYSRLYVVTLLV